MHRLNEITNSVGCAATMKRRYFFVQGAVNMGLFGLIHSSLFENVKRKKLENEW